MCNNVQLLMHILKPKSFIFVGIVFLKMLEVKGVLIYNC